MKINIAEFLKRYTPLTDDVLEGFDSEVLLADYERRAQILSALIPDNSYEAISPDDAFLDEEEIKNAVESLANDMCLILDYLPTKPRAATSADSVIAERAPEDLDEDRIIKTWTDLSKRSRKAIKLALAERLIRKEGLRVMSHEDFNWH